MGVIFVVLVYHFRNQIIGFIILSFLMETKICKCHWNTLQLEQSSVDSHHFLHNNKNKHKCHVSYCFRENLAFSTSYNLVIFSEDSILVESFYWNMCYWHYKNVMGRKRSSNIEKGSFPCYFGKLWLRLNSTNKHLVSSLKCYSYLVRVKILMLNSVNSHELPSITLFKKHRAANSNLGSGFIYSGPNNL